MLEEWSFIYSLLSVASTTITALEPVVLTALTQWLLFTVQSSLVLKEVPVLNDPSWVSHRKSPMLFALNLPKYHIFSSLESTDIVQKGGMRGCFSILPHFLWPTFCIIVHLWFSSYISKWPCTPALILSITHTHTHTTATTPPSLKSHSSFVKKAPAACIPQFLNPLQSSLYSEHPTEPALTKVTQVSLLVNLIGIPWSLSYLVPL